MTKSPPHRPLIVLSIEGLARSSLGCYGCSWNQTPAIDDIAAGGVVWDRMIAESDQSPRVLKSWLDSDWLSCWDPMGPLELVTDVSDDNWSDRFHHVTQVPSAIPPDQPANDIVETHLGRLVAAAIERDQIARHWSVMWIHTDSITRCWDAPRNLFPLEQLDGDEDLEPLEIDLLEDPTESSETAAPQIDRLFDTTVPPDFSLHPDDHPDWVSSWMRTYGCQVRLLDVLIEVLLQSLNVTDPWFVLVGTSGFRLGQSGWIGSRGGSLRSADIHLPFLVSDLGPLRVPRLVGSRSIPNLLQRLADPEPSISSDQLAKHLDQGVAIETESEQVRRAITAEHWFYVQDNDQSEHLFLKPDDIEDFNDVARVREEVVEEFRED